jgi:hypothetical protein
LSSEVSIPSPGGAEEITNEEMMKRWVKKDEDLPGGRQGSA